MTRPTLRLAAIAAVGACTLLSGCSTFTDNTLAARVGSAELSHDDLADLVTARQIADDPTFDPDTAPGRIDAEAQRSVVGDFVTIELIRNDIDALGIDVPPIDDTLTGTERMDAEFAALGQAWLGAPIEQLGDPALQAWYEQGPGETGYLCGQHILVATADEADAVLDRLAAGEPFAEVAVDVSIDPQSSQQGGAIGCITVDNIESVLGPEYLDAVSDLEFGQPSTPVETDAGFYVIDLTPFAGLTPDNVVYGRLLALADWADIFTDPAIGVYRALAVTPLG